MNAGELPPRTINPEAATRFHAYRRRVTKKEPT